MEYIKGYDALIARLRDLEYQRDKHYRITSTSFLNENEWQTAQKILGSQSLYRLDGGYEGAEKRKVFFLVDEDDETDIVCLVAKYNNRFVKLTHRDVLGALMSLNIKREEVGDIWVEEDKIVIYTSSKWADFICMNLSQIHKAQFYFEVSEEHLVYHPPVKTFVRTVSSNRLDCIVAVMAGCSRTKAQEMIRQQLVSINHEIVEDVGKLCNNECTVSIRKTGRFRYKGVKGITKKDRMAIEIDQFI